MDAWLTFTSTLIWQAIVLVALIFFRNEIQALIRRLGRFKHGETELAFQEPTSDLQEPSEAVGKALEVRDEEGFFTRNGIESLVAEASNLEADEHPLETMLVFRTPKQQTWLVSTRRQVFFLLDDERTRASQRIIQLRQGLDNSFPVGTRDESETTGVFQLGQSGWWYYSFELLGAPGAARLRLESFLSTARA